MALAGLANPGPRGYTEILYAFSSAAGNNGSAFAGLTANAPWYNTTLGIAMLACRFGIIVPVMAIAGSLAAKPKLAPVGRHLPDPRPAVRRPAGRRDRHPQRPRILPRARARPDRRALPDARRQDVLTLRRRLHGRSRHEISSDASASATRPPSTDPALIRRAVVDAFRKLDPRALVSNPVIFVTAVVSALVTVLFVRDLVTGQPALFTGQIAAWLWFTVLFANFAEAIAEGRGRAQADALRRTRTRDTRQAAC